MQSIPVDVARMVFLAMESPRPKVKDRRTGEVAVDRDGRPVTVVRCACVPADEASDEDAALEVIQTVAEVPPLRRGSQVTITGLVARPWSFRDERGEVKAGVTYWADSIVPVGPQRGGAS